MATTRDCLAFLQRTLVFIKKNKDLIDVKKEKAPLTYRQIIDTFEERIETHLKEWQESNSKLERG